MIFGDDVALLFDSSRTRREKFKPKEGIVEFARVILIGILGCVGFQVLVEVAADGQTSIHIMAEVPAIDEHGECDIGFRIECVLYDGCDYICGFVFAVLDE